MAIFVSGDDWLSPPTEQRMAESVTRHALIPTSEGWQLLLCGVDTLDFGLFVEFGSHWPLLRESLERLKEQAQGKNGLIDQTPRGRTFLHLPSGMGCNYRFHLQFPEYHLYLAKGPRKDSPNAYLSINAETLWQLGVYRALDLAFADLACFKGTAYRILPSRVDLCADFHIPGGLSLDFLQEHKVARSRSTANYSNADQLETFYCGSPGGSVRLRIYDKGKEAQKKGKAWFPLLWGRDDFADVWRVEFQLRRLALKQFQVNTLEDLMQKIGGIWSYLTGEWFSLRLADDKRQDRRTVHPWWQDVQACACKIGPSADVQRIFDAGLLASVEWYVSHIAGCLPSFAARLGIHDFNEALNRLGNEVTQYWFSRQYDQEFQKRSVKVGRPLDEIGGDDGEE